MYIKLNILAKFLNDASLKKLEDAKNNLGSSHSGEGTPSKEWFTEQGLNPPPDAVSEDDRNTQTIEFKNEDLDEFDSVILVDLNEIQEFRKIVKHGKDASDKERSCNTEAFYKNTEEASILVKETIEEIEQLIKNNK